MENMEETQVELWKDGKYGRKVSWIVKIYGRKISRIVKIYGKCGRKVSWMWKDIESMEER